MDHALDVLNIKELQETIHNVYQFNVLQHKLYMLTEIVNHVKLEQELTKPREVVYQF